MFQAVTEATRSAVSSQKTSQSISVQLNSSQPIPKHMLTQFLLMLQSGKLWLSYIEFLFIKTAYIHIHVWGF